MDKSLDIIAWNLRDGINNPNIQDVILACQADVAIFPEARAEDESLAAETTINFHNAGYEIFDKNYNDDDGRRDRHGLVLIAKPELVHEAHTVRLAGRNAIHLTLVQGTHLMGVHLDDRGELRRRDQADIAIRTLGDTAVIAGDFNAMHGSDGIARLLRRVGPFADKLPARDPVRGEKTPKIQRLGSLAQRLVSMAIGTTLSDFESAGFRDASEDHMPTMRKGPMAVQLDHILFRGSVGVEAPTEVRDGNGLSDHKLIHARLTCK